MLRVISGKYKNRKLEQPNISITRPTTDRTKEAIFSMIQFKIDNKIFLDLFSGSGSIAIEAVSRGAMKAIAVEKNNDACKVITKNIEKININNIDIRKSDAIEYLKRSKGLKFGIIYIDPPFSEVDLYNQALFLIVKNNLLDKDGYVIVESSKNKIEIPNGLVMIKNRKYGKSKIMLLSNNI